MTLAAVRTPIHAKRGGRATGAFLAVLCADERPAGRQKARTPSSRGLSRSNGIGDCDESRVFEFLQMIGDLLYRHIDRSASSRVPRVLVDREVLWPFPRRGHRVRPRLFVDPDDL